MSTVIKVAVLGSTGMVGHAVTAWLQKSSLFDVTPFSRRRDNAHFFDVDTTDMSVLDDFDYIVNCIGLIWQRADVQPYTMKWINGTFPKLLQFHCEETMSRHPKLIHVSTDCVFSGKRGHYTEDDVLDAVDNYGTSKIFGEPEGAMVIRSSVIGRELDTRRSFLEWALSSRGTRVDGYVNHVWNGLTSLEYARCIRRIIEHDMWRAGVVHLFSTPALTKYDLLWELNKRLDLRMDITPVCTPITVLRTLETVNPLCAVLDVPDIFTQIDELKERHE
jgi:dTDP-4-dehydrorhamnose reductase